MPTLKDFVTMHLDEMAWFTQFDSNLYEYYENVQFYPNIPLFDENMWKDMSRELRGVPLLYDDYKEFWGDFQPWWKLRVKEYARIFVTVALEYNLLHNYDRTETITEKTATKGNERTSAEDSRRGESNATQSATGTVKDVVMNNDTSTEKVSGFNSAEGELSTKGQTNRTLDGVTTSNSDNAATGESKHSENSTAHGEKTSAGEVETTREVRMYGNIGVTTSQQMLTEERRLMSDHVINYIVKDFKQAFCLLVY